MTKSSHPLLSIELTKAAAIVLVVNSHLDWLWGSSIMASGGSLGNSLFFLISGVGLEIGWRKHASLYFYQWYMRRVKRIYPSVVIVSLAGLALGITNFWPSSLPGLAKILIYPTNFWFISAILLFYVPGYLVLRIRQKRLLLGLAAISLVIYFTWYSQLDLSLFVIEGDSYFRWIFYFLVFLTGIAMARSNQPKVYDPLEADCCIANGSEKHFRDMKPEVIFLVLAAVFYLCSKIMFSGFMEWVMPFQFVVQLATLCLAVSIARISIPLSTILLRGAHLRSLVMLLSSLTLEIYLVDSLTRLSPLQAMIGANLQTTTSPFARILIAIVFFVVLMCLSSLIARASKQALSFRSGFSCNHS